MRLCYALHRCFVFLAIFCVCQTLVWTIVYQGFLAFQRSLIEYDVVYEEIGEIISCGYGVAIGSVALI